MRSIDQSVIAPLLFKGLNEPLLLVQDGKRNCKKLTWIFFMCRDSSMWSTLWNCLRKAKDFLLSSKCALKTTKRLCFCSQILRRLGLLRFLHFNMCVLYTICIHIYIYMCTYYDMCVISLLFGCCIVFVTSASCVSMSSVVLVSHLR